MARRTQRSAPSRDRTSGLPAPHPAVHAAQRSRQLELTHLAACPCRRRRGERHTRQLRHRIRGKTGIRHRSIPVRSLCRLVPTRGYLPAPRCPGSGPPSPASPRAVPWPAGSGGEEARRPASLVWLAVVSAGRVRRGTSQPATRFRSASARRAGPSIAWAAAGGVRTGRSAREAWPRAPR